MSQNKDVDNALQIQRQIRKQEEHSGNEKEIQNTPMLMKVQSQQTNNNHTKKNNMKVKKSTANDKRKEDEEEKRNNCDDTTISTLKTLTTATTILKNLESNMYENDWNIKSYENNKQNSDAGEKSEQERQEEETRKRLDKCESNTNLVLDQGDELSTIEDRQDGVFPPRPQSLLAMSVSNNFSSLTFESDQYDQHHGVEDREISGFESEENFFADENTSSATRSTDESGRKFIPMKLNYFRQRKSKEKERRKKCFHFSNTFRKLWFRSSSSTKREEGGKAEADEEDEEEEDEDEEEEEGARGVSDKKKRKKQNTKNNKNRRKANWLKGKEKGHIITSSTQKDLVRQNISSSFDNEQNKREANELKNDFIMKEVTENKNDSKTVMSNLNLDNVSDTNGIEPKSGCDRKISEVIIKENNIKSHNNCHYKSHHAEDEYLTNANDMVNRVEHSNDKDKGDDDKDRNNERDSDEESDLMPMMPPSLSRERAFYGYRAASYTNSQ